MTFTSRSLSQAHRRASITGSRTPATGESTEEADKTASSYYDLVHMANMHAPMTTLNPTLNSPVSKRAMDSTGVHAPIETGKTKLRAT